jgi:hypothetical protein
MIVCVCVSRTETLSLFMPSLYGVLFLVVLVCSCMFVHDVCFE